MRRHSRQRTARPAAASTEAPRSTRVGVSPVNGIVTLK
jgi:hypothetical protein